MKRLLSLTAVLALAAARPETYKETEDFNYQRSSSDEGSKSGFYNAQRGNMGGNYERAHNMDGLAQHQMGTAIKQVEGELGEASKMRSGQVFTSAQSGGMFGSGHYDLSNLQGRNFHENGYGAAGSQSHSALSSQQSAFNTHNLAYNSHASNSGSHYGGYQGTKTGQLNSGNLQAIDDVQGINYGYGTHGAATRHSSGVSSHSGYHSQNMYENSNANQYGTHSAYGAVPQNRLIYTAPVRVYGRPGSRVAVPVGVQTYDATHSASALGHSASAFDQTASTFDHSAATLGHSAAAIDQSASTVDQNAINTEAEVLNAGDQHIVGYRPTSNAKHYESSYNYRKQWEKHDVKPEIIALAIPTESPFPENSELYEDAQASNNQYHASGVNSHSGYSSSIHNAHNSNVKSSSASQLHQAAIDSQHAALLSSSNAAGVYNSANSANSANALGESDTKPKSYQSSYSYHKSWERQGDPYVIKPVGGAYTNLDSQSLADASSHQAYSHQSGSNYRKTHQGYTHGNGLDDCDSDGYRRVARSVRNAQADDDLTQQSQTSWSNVEDLRQQAQNGWDLSDSLRQGYQQNTHVQQQAQQNQWDNIEDLGQLTQTSWDQSDALRQAHNYQNGDVQQQVQQKQWGSLEDLGQQTQNSWDSADAIRHAHKLQNTQTQQHQLGKLEDLGQVQQNNWDSEDLTQQTQQHKWDSQSHSGQEIVSVWPGHASLHTFENQDQDGKQKNPAGLLNLDITNQKPQSQSDPWERLDQQHMQAHFNSGYNVQEQQSESNTWNDLGQEKIQQGHAFSKYPNDMQGQEQQSQSSPWDDLGQQQIQQGKTTEKHPEDTASQQTNTNWAVSEYFDHHKYNNQHQQEEGKLPPASKWSAGNSYFENQQVYQHLGSFNSNDLSQKTDDKTDSDFSQLSSLWDKISEVDGQFSASNSQMGREYKNNDINVNQRKYHGNQDTVILTAKPEIRDKPTIEQNISTPPSPISRHDIGRGDIGPEKVTEDYRHDIGRGDIGPEEDLVEPNSFTKIEENKSNGHAGNDHTKENNKNLTKLNEGFEEERRSHQYHITNSTYHSWNQENNYSENSSKNQTTQQSTYQNGYKYNRNETDDSHIYNKHYLSSVLSVGNQKFVPSNQWAQSSLNDDKEQISQQNSDNLSPQNSDQLSELEPMDIQQQQHNIFRFDKEPVETQQEQQSIFDIDQAQVEMQQQQHMFNFGDEQIQQQKQQEFDVVEDPVESQQQQQQQHMFDIDEAGFEHIRQNDQETQFNQNDNLLRQTLEHPVQLTQMQKIGNIKTEPQELDDLYRNNHNLQHHTNHQTNQASLKSPENKNIVQYEQMSQNSSTLVEPTTEKPGFFKRFKNNFFTLFSKKDNSE